MDKQEVEQLLDYIIGEFFKYRTMEIAVQGTKPLDINYMNKLIEFRKYIKENLK